MLVGASGCTIGPPGYMDDYATIGGKWQRADPVEGRVGSAFSDGSVMFDHARTPSMLTMPSAMSEGEAIYDDGVIIDGTGFDTYEGDFEVAPFYENGIEIVPQYETLGEDW